MLVFQTNKGIYAAMQTQTLQTIFKQITFIIFNIYHLNKKTSIISTDEMRQKYRINPPDITSAKHDRGKKIRPKPAHRQGIQLGKKIVRKQKQHAAPWVAHVVGRHFLSPRGTFLWLSFGRCDGGRCLGTCFFMVAELRVIS